MARVPEQLIWEIVKKNNSFLVKEFGNGTASVKFSKEPNNLCNLHSYKHFGLANKKTVILPTLPILAASDAVSLFAGTDYSSKVEYMVKNLAYACLYAIYENSLTREVRTSK